MADQGKEAKEAEAPAAGGGDAPKKPGLFTLEFLLALLNTLAIAGALGTFVYVKVIFKRPDITEETERARIAEQRAKESAAAAQPGSITFKPAQFNIQSSPSPDGDAPRLHYATIGFVMTIRDSTKMKLMDQVSTAFYDQIVQLLGKRSIEELTTVQGRYQLRTDFQDIVNGLASDNIVTNIYFTHFLVQ